MPKTPYMPARYKQMLHYSYLYQITRRDFKKKFGLLKEITALFSREFAAMCNKVQLSALDKRF